VALFGGNAYSVSVKFLADLSGFTANIDKATGKLEKFGASATKIGKGMTMAITAPLIAMGTAAVNASLQMNKGMADVATLIPGNIQRVEELKKGVQDLSVQWGKSTADMTRGLYEVVSAFGDTNETLAQLEIASKLATAGVSTTLDALRLLSAITKGYGDTSAEAMRKASDLMMTVVKLGQTTFPELAASITGTIPLAASLGVKIEEVAGLFATLTGVTGNAAEVGTQVEGMLAGLMKQTDTMAKSIKGLGYETAQQMIEALGLVEAYKQLIATTDGTQESISKLLMRREGLTALFALTGGQADTFTKKMQAMGDAAGYTDEAVREQTEGINAAGFAWDVFKTKLSVTLQKWGDDLLPFFEKLLDFFDRTISKLGDMADGFNKADPAMQKFYITIGLIVVALGPLLIGLGKLAQAFVFIRMALVGGAVAGAAGAAGGGAAVGAGLIAALTGTAAVLSGLVLIIGAGAAAFAFEYTKRVKEAKEMTEWLGVEVERSTIRIIKMFRTVKEGFAALDIFQKTPTIGGTGILDIGKLESQLPAAIDYLREIGKLTDEAADSLKYLIEVGGQENLVNVYEAVKKVYGTIPIGPEVPSLTVVPGGGGGGGGTGGAGDAGVQEGETPTQAKLRRWIERTDQIIEDWNRRADEAWEVSRQPSIAEAVKKIIDLQGLAQIRDQLNNIGGLAFSLKPKTEAELFGEEQRRGLAGTVQSNRRAIADSLSDAKDGGDKLFADLGNILMEGIRGIVESIQSGDIGGAIQNLFSMLGNTISTNVSKMIETSIGGGGMFGSIMGALGGGLVGVGISLLGGLFGGKDKDRGSEPSKPIYVYDTHWDQYFRLGMTLPSSYVRSGRSDMYNVDPHGRTADGWSTGQHFDA